MNVKHYILVGLSLLAFASCSENDDTVEEFPDWKNKNEQYFEAAYQSHNYDYALRKYSLSEEAPSSASDYVLVDVLGSGDANEPASPYLNDSVEVHYSGRLIPSTTYTAGYEFDKSYLEPFDEDTAVPSKFIVNGVVTGFGTALQKMHRGDHWRVTIPYQLGYGAVDMTSGGIPAYSTLIFEIRLVDFWTTTRGDRD